MRMTGNEVARLVVKALFGLVVLTGCSAVADLEPVDQGALQKEAILPGLDGLEGQCPVLEMGLVSGQALPAIIEHKVCGHPYPYKITGLNGPKRVSFNTDAQINCVMATQLQRYFADSVQPTAEDMFGQPVVEVRVAATYACRSRNNQRGAKLSEHAKMNAFDMSALTLADGTIVSVEQDWHSMGRKGRFLRAINRSACRYFTTVIGPSGDKYHQDHIHLDHGRHGRKGTWRLCQ